MIRRWTFSGRHAAGKLLWPRWVDAHNEATQSTLMQSKAVQTAFEAGVSVGISYRENNREPRS